jgi:hypothetical protein
VSVQLPLLDEGSETRDVFTNTPSQKPQTLARVVLGLSHSNVIEIPLSQSVDPEAPPANLTTDFTEGVELHLHANTDAEYANPV